MTLTTLNKTNIQSSNRLRTLIPQLTRRNSIVARFALFPNRVLPATLNLYFSAGYRASRDAASSPAVALPPHFMKQCWQVIINKSATPLMIDENGYRLNVGIILLGPPRHVFWAKRIGQDAWQFPQGGMQAGESPVEAMHRELLEETGLAPEDIEIVDQTKSWIYYQLPKNLIRQNMLPLCIGQKQMWFLLKLTTAEQKIQLNLTDKPEFDSWNWVPYRQPLKEVIFFKREAYKQVLNEFEPYFTR